MENRIQMLRKEKNITQDDLAKIIGVVRSTIGGYERNAIFPSQDKLILLSQYFGVSSDYIIGKSDIRNELSLDSRDIYTNIQTIIDLLRSPGDTYFLGIKLTDFEKQTLYDFIYQNLVILRSIIQKTSKTFNVHSR